MIVQREINPVEIGSTFNDTWHVKDMIMGRKRYCREIGKILILLHIIR